MTDIKTGGPVARLRGTTRSHPHGPHRGTHRKGGSDSQNDRKGQWNQS